MAKIKFYPVLAIFSLFLLCPALCAEENINLSNLQKTSENQSLLEEDEVEELISAESQWQYLEWLEDYPEYVAHYDVIVERLEEGEYKEERYLTTEGNTTKIQITPSLKPGNYRYKVITYNLIGIAEAESEWTGFNIYIAYQPEIRSLNVESNLTATIYLEEINDGIISVDGRNLFLPKENQNDITFTDYVLKKERESKEGEVILIPEILKHSENNRSITFKFDPNAFDTGVYNLIAKDASGLENQLGSNTAITVKFKKRVDIDLSGGYACPVVLFDGTINEYFGTKVFPVSGYAKLNVLPFKHRWGYLGAGVQSSYTRMFAEHNGYTIDGNLITGFLNVVYQLPIRKRIENSISTKHLATIELHGGLGITMFNNFAFHFDHNVSTKALNSTNISLDAGVAFHFYATKRLFIEAGLDLICAYVTDMMFGMVLPTAGVGWQF